MSGAAGRHAIVLAAGGATRFGGGKLTAGWRGAPLIRWAVRAALASRVERVTVVVGAAAESVIEALAGINDARLCWVKADDWGSGQAASLKAGLRALPDDACSVAVFLGDMPAVDPGLADALLDAVAAGAAAARLMTPDGPGHPAAFHPSVFPALLDLSGDQGARGLFAGLGDKVVVLRTSDPGATLDIDHPADLSQAYD